MPPTIVVTRSDMMAPKASKVLPIWKASSRVGARTRENSGWGLSRRACRMGRAKAAVFPDPVSARATTSLPWSATGIDSAWIWVGRSYLRDAQASANVSTIPCGKRGQRCASRLQTDGAAYQVFERLGCFFFSFLLLLFFVFLLGNLIAYLLAVRLFAIAGGRWWHRHLFDCLLFAARGRRRRPAGAMGHLLALCNLFAAHGVCSLRVVEVVKRLEASTGPIRLDGNMVCKFLVGSVIKRLSPRGQRQFGHVHTSGNSGVKGVVVLDRQCGQTLLQCF